MQNKHPKVLIIGETFRQDTGGGITITNLFQKWPADKLAVITTSDNNDHEICKHYYRIGNKEENTLWPFRLLKINSQSGDISFSENKPHLNKVFQKRSPKYFKPTITRVFGFLSHFLGFHHKIHSIQVSQELLDWIKSFNPSIIYFQPNSLALVLFVKQLYELTRIPIALHIVDDYVNTKNKPGLFYYKYERKIQCEYEEIINISKVHFSICLEMSKEFSNRFHKEFIPIHNPIIKEAWLPYINNNFEQRDITRIVYAGRIGIANVKALIMLVDIIEKLRNEGTSIEFDIYSIDEDKYLLKTLKNKSGSYYKSFISHSALPETLSKYDLLFLPLSITEKSIRYTRLSMPTKVAEYMITGKAIIVFAPPATALYKYAKAEKWAYVTSDEKQLVDGLRNLINSKELKVKYGKTAQKVALANHEIKEVADKFTDAIIKCLN